MYKITAALAAAALLVGCGQKTTITAAGATFPAPLYQRWFQIAPVQVNYQAVGSGAGVRQMEAGTLDFGASDAAIKDPDSNIVHIPSTGGAIALLYNNPSCPDLQLTQWEVVGIYNGTVTNWNQVGCLSGEIIPVHRSDGSGTTAAFTASLDAFDDDWKQGNGKSVAWPAGIGGKGNSGVTAVVRQNRGAIGYVNYSYAMAPGSQVAAVQNAAGNFVLPTPENATIGLEGITLDEDLKGIDPNPAGAQAYPIVTYTWILAYPTHPKNEEIKEVFRFVLSPDAQKDAVTLGYVPLPESIRLRALDAVDSLR